VVLAAGVCGLGGGPSASAAQKGGGQDKEVIVLNVAGKLTVADPKDRVRKGSHHQVHEVRLQAGKQYVIDLVSTDFDAFLRLEDDSGNQLAADDDSGGGTNARLGIALLQTGRYRIIATSFKAGETGAYRLTVKEMSKGQAERLLLAAE